MHRKVLVANRGEIAVRIIRACRMEELPTVAVYSDVDRTELHVRMADQAVNLGPPEPARSYLNIERVVDAARRTGAEAIHPGYGFLSENADFAQAVEDAGLVFIGPGAEAIRSMGDKITARKTMDAAGVPVVPGTLDAVSDADEALEIAEEIGSTFSRVGAYNALGTAQLIREDWAEAERALSTALELVRLNRTGREFEAMLLFRLARSRLGRGDAAGARRAAEESVTLARERGQLNYESQARIALARALCASEGGEARAAVEDELERASALLEATGCRVFEPWIAEWHAEHFWLTNRRALCQPGVALALWHS